MDPSQHYLFPTKLGINKKRVIHLSLGSSRIQAETMELYDLNYLNKSIISSSVHIED